MSLSLMAFGPALLDKRMKTTHEPIAHGIRSPALLDKRMKMCIYARGATMNEPIAHGIRSSFTG